jgi:hypothetical protein
MFEESQHHIHIVNIPPSPLHERMRTVPQLDNGTPSLSASLVDDSLGSPSSASLLISVTHLSLSIDPSNIPTCHYSYGIIASCHVTYLILQVGDPRYSCGFLLELHKPSSRLMLSHRYAVEHSAHVRRCSRASDSKFSRSVAFHILHVCRATRTC